MNETLNWKDNYWFPNLKKGDKVRVVKLTPSDLYPREMNDTIGKIGVVTNPSYPSSYGKIVLVEFNRYEQWSYFPNDLERIY
jgi:hypothetical protein